MPFSRILRNSVWAFVAAALMVAGLFRSSPVYAAEPSFSTKTVDAGRTPSLALDSGGSAAIAYCFLVNPSGSANSYQLRYAERTDRYNPAADWSWVVIETLPVNTACADSSLIIDGAGTIHIAYLTQFSSTYQIKYATRLKTSGVWTIQVVDISTTRVYQTPSLAVTPTGLPRIAYYDSTNKDLIYAENNGSGWQINFSFDTAGNVGLSPSLVISKSGIEHLVYTDRTNTPNFKHGWRDSNGWHFESFDPLNDPSSGGTLVKAAVIGDESLHVTYIFSAPCGSNLCISIRYAKWANQVWADEEITAITNFSGSLTDLVIGVTADGVPSVSYLYWNGAPYGNSVLYVWTKGTGAWAAQTLPQNYHMTSMAMDARGNTHTAIFYCNYQYCTTQYAYKERTYTVIGKVLNRSGQGVQGVTVTAGGITAVTDAGGNFTLNLPKGTAHLVATKPGVGFVNSSYRIAIPAGLPANIVFVSSDYGPAPAAFLHFPIHYASQEEEVQALYPNQPQFKGGKINYWFDHRFPNNGTANGDADDPMVLPYHLTLTASTPNLTQQLDAYGYSGHDGIDIKGIQGVTSVYAAYAGKVVRVVRGQVNCYPTCKGNYGNLVVIDHSQGGVPGYYTLYAHLNNVIVDAGQPVTSDTILGTLGNTGYSSGPHLHFSLHRDDGILNADGKTQWDGVSKDKPVDPYGWLANANGRNNMADPYVEEKFGPPSAWLWTESAPLNVQIAGSDGATVQDSRAKATLTFPAGFFTGIAQFELQQSPGPAPTDFWRSLGLTYRLALINGLQNTPPQTAPQSQSVGLAGESDPSQFSVTLEYDPAQLAHLNEAGLVIQRWEEVDQTWIALPSTVDPSSRTVTASSDRFGIYDLQAPLICPTDGLEGNDTLEAASPFNLAAGLQNQIIDAPTDQDWYVFQAPATQAETVQVEDAGASVNLVLTLYSDDLQILASGSSAVSWAATENTLYYLNVASQESGASGCSSVYSLRSVIVTRVFLPMVRR